MRVTRSPPDSAGEATCATTAWEVIEPEQSGRHGCASRKLGHVRFGCVRKNEEKEKVETVLDDDSDGKEQ